MYGRYGRFLGDDRRLHFYDIIRFILYNNNRKTFVGRFRKKILLGGGRINEEFEIVGILYDVIEEMMSLQGNRRIFLKQKENFMR